ncbi:hypothetical protein ABT186_40175 [Streptomyces sp. NPDC001634]|uniref:hypothetical protein n=1 Tax=Streptomyces sp. NPDC001634 TaxID=3154390 RepID=UPI00331FC1C7
MPGGTAPDACTPGDDGSAGATGRRGSVAPEAAARSAAVSAFDMSGTAPVSVFFLSPRPLRL